jgi:hypothetical protein
MREDFRLLRKKLDGNEPFMTNGHSVLDTRGTTQNPKRVSQNPDWTKSDAKIRELLLTVFPKMHTDRAQRRRAGRWFRIIYLYYRANLPASRVGGNMHISRERIKRFLRSINRVANGFTAGGKPRGLRPRGRQSNASITL